jgi:hypothetical protein
MMNSSYYSYTCRLGVVVCNSNLQNLVFFPGFIKVRE